MDSAHQINVPLRYASKKMKKRRELNALLTNSLVRKSFHQDGVSKGLFSQDKLLSASTDDPDDYKWPKIHQRINRNHKRKDMFSRICRPTLLLMGIVFIICFLYWIYFDLHQQVYNYRLKVDEVFAETQKFPDLLQKWHETSKISALNQTKLYIKVNELQSAIEILYNNFTQYKNYVDVKQRFDKNEKLVADFGAKLEAWKSDLDTMMEDFSSLADTQKNLRNDFFNLQANFSALQSRTSGTKWFGENYIEKIKLVQSNLISNMSELKINQSRINNTLTQVASSIHDELIDHKTKLDLLFDHFENVSSHVETVENSWAQYKQRIGNDIITLRNSIQNIKNTVDKNYAKREELSFETIKSPNIIQATVHPKVVNQSEGWVSTLE